ncbi:MAG: TIGR01620 family protein, partial [Xanthobacteraceae bacterium]
MSVRDHRRPAAFRLDDPHVVVTSPDEPPARGNRATVLVTPEPDAAALPVVVERPSRRRRGLP